MKVQMQFTRYINHSWEEAQKLEKQGMEVEEEFYWDEAYIDVSQIILFSTSSGNNIKIWLKTGDEFIIKREKDIWLLLTRYFDEITDRLTMHKPMKVMPNSN